MFEDFRTKYVRDEASSDVFQGLLSPLWSDCGCAALTHFPKGNNHIDRIMRGTLHP